MLKSFIFSVMVIGVVVYGVYSIVTDFVAGLLFFAL